MVLLTNGDKPGSAMPDWLLVSHLLFGFGGHRLLVLYT
jgi:hypothetical protein